MKSQKYQRNPRTPAKNYYTTDRKPSSLWKKGYIAWVMAGCVLAGSATKIWADYKSKNLNLQENVIPNAIYHNNPETNKISYCTLEDKDNLLKISRETGLPLETLAQLNPEIKNLDNVKIGQRINLETLKDEIQENNYEKTKIQEKEYTLLGMFAYGEAANQKDQARKAIVKVILNRIGKKGYSYSLDGVVRGESEFTCVGSKKNKNWKQATGELKRNPYEEKIFKECLKNAEEVLKGEKLNYENENNWIAYFDDSISYEKLVKFNPKYWKQVQPDVKIGKIVLCVPRGK